MEKSEESLCCICQTELCMPVTLDPCKHKLCVGCFAELASRANLPLSCPICREPIVSLQPLEEGASKEEHMTRKILNLNLESAQNRGGRRIARNPEADAEAQRHLDEEIE